MMRPLTYLPVIDFIIFFISSSRDFHASPSLLKTGPLLLAAPLPTALAFDPFPNFFTVPATSSPCEANLLTPVATLEPWKASPIPSRADQRDWPAPSQSPSQAQGPAARCYAGHGSASGGQASPGPSGTRVRRCPLLSPSFLANSRISTMSVRPLRASTVLASMPAGISRLRARAVGDTPRRAASPPLPTRATSPPMCSAMPAVHPRSVPDQPRPLLRPRGSQVRHLLGLDASYI